MSFFFMLNFHIFFRKKMLETLDVELILNFHQQEIVMLIWKLWVS